MNHTPYRLESIELFCRCRLVPHFIILAGFCRANALLHQVCTFHKYLQQRLTNQSTRTGIPLRSMPAGYFSR